MAKEKKKPAKFQFTLHVDVQCGVCRALMHQQDNEPLPKFCRSCGAGLERFCLNCRKKADMFFDEWWPEETECRRTYCSARRCQWCNAVLTEDLDENEGVF